jgi:adenine phosphoribosyltransferase
MERQYVNDDLRDLIRTIPDYPKPGIQFRDITTLLLDGAGFRRSIERLADIAGPAPDLIAGIEARGFIFGAALAQHMGCGLVLLRKKNKLPGRVTGINYALEYGQDRIEMHADAVAPGARVLLVDDLIATGGTALAGIELLQGAGAIVDRAAFVIDLPDLGGAARLRAKGIDVAALVGFEGD